MRIPMANIPVDIRGVRFLTELTGAYDSEEQRLRLWVLRLGRELEAAIEQSDLISQQGVPEFLAELSAATEFLQSIPDESVSLYSYDHDATTDELLTAFSESGANDWALEEVGGKGEKGRRELLSVLKKEKDKERQLAAISMLLIVFHDDHTLAAIERFLDACDEEIGKEAAKLVAAYTSSHSKVASRQPRRRSDGDNAGR